jgi:ethanolaminephosphotransferase
MSFINKEGLKRIQEHEYVSGSYTIIDNLMQPWWEFVAKLVPHSIAPNMVTLIGLGLNVSGVCVFLYHDTTQTKEIPMWCHLYGAMCLFLY